MDFSSLIKEIVFKTARSGGPGGQHVNKVETKVILTFNILDSKYLNEEQKQLLISNLQRKSTKGILQFYVSESRSQSKNKEIAIIRFKEIIEKGLIREKERKQTRIPKEAKEKRLNEKKRTSELKKSRGKIDF